MEGILPSVPWWECLIALVSVCLLNPTGEVFDYLVSHGRMKEVEARAKFRQV